jgi:inward rectifier potassium channel
MKIKLLGIKKSLFQDLYYRIVKMSWSRFIFLAAFGYIVLNLIFATFYYFSPAEILNVRHDSLWDSFIFSFQTSSTVGYGHFLPKSDTAHAIVIVDTMVGIFYVALVTGLAFSKFSLPSAKILFSDKILYTQFDGRPCLIFRMGNHRDSQIVEAKLNVAILLPYKSLEGLEMRRSYPLKLLSQGNPIFSLTWTAIHPIDEQSPLFGLTLAELKKRQAIVFVSLTGLDAVLSQTVYGHYRYPIESFREGSRFVDILQQDGDNSYSVDFEKFHDIHS